LTKVYNVAMSEFVSEFGSIFETKTPRALEITEKQIVTDLLKRQNIWTLQHMPRGPKEVYTVMSRPHENAYLQSEQHQYTVDHRRYIGFKEDRIYVVSSELDYSDLEVIEQIDNKIDPETQYYEAAVFSEETDHIPDFSMGELTVLRYFYRSKHELALDFATSYKDTRHIVASIRRKLNAPLDGMVALFAAKNDLIEFEEIPFGRTRDLSIEDIEFLKTHLDKTTVEIAVATDTPTEQVSLRFQHYFSTTGASSMRQLVLMMYQDGLFGDRK
jgi:hypothetical protein